MEFCHWCSKKIKQGRFCGVECLQAAAEMPDLINNQAIKTPAKVYSKRRIALGVVGSLALVGGLCVALFTTSGKLAPVPSVAVNEPICVYPPAKTEPTPPPVYVQTAKGPVSVFTFTNTRNAKTSEIDAMVQGTLPKLQGLYGNMMLDNGDGSTPSGVLELSFLIQEDGSVKWVSRTGNSFSPLLDSAAIKGLQNLNFGEFPLIHTSLGNERYTSEIEVKVIYHFGNDTIKNLSDQINEPDQVAKPMPYFETIIR
jgi:hypothetical protein